MRNVAMLSDNDRRELFRNTADKMGLHDAIVEKDFWVCFTLDYLFHRSPWKDSITFKGGTSLSKAFHLISRFSEDIDLILDWHLCRPAGIFHSLFKTVYINIIISDALHLREFHIFSPICSIPCARIVWM